MASNEMDAAKLQDELKDITECCICAETYEDPRILPCIHTFCKKCLDDTGSKFGKKPGEWMPCPLCRRQFTIPFAGFLGIQKNFFMARLIEMTKSSSIPSCALCNTSSVEMYCKECCVNLCNNCCKSHRTNKLTKNHEVVIIENQKTPRQTQDNLVSDICQKHDKERLKIYCFDCKTIVCAFCYIESHQSHNWSDVNKAAETFRNQIQYSIWNLAFRNKGLQEKKEELSQTKLNILTSVKSLELKINQRKAFLKGIIDKHAGLLLADLEAMHQEKLKIIELQEDEIDMLMTDQDSYSFYCQQITTDKSDGDVCRADAELGKRSAQLQEMNDSICQHHIQPFNVSFKISKLDQFLKKNGTNFVGKIEAADAESVTELEKKNESGPVKTVVTGAKSKRQDKKKRNLVAKATADQEGKKSKDSLSPQENKKPPKTKMSRLKTLRTPTGIRNAGNTCYFGAAIQNLCHTLHLAEELRLILPKQSPLDTELDSKQLLTNAYVEFACRGYEANCDEIFRQLFKEFCKKSPRFADRGQHDSHNSLIHFLSCLRDEERRRHGSSKSAGFRNVLTAVDKVFGGHTITVYVCYTCNTPYHVCEPFLDLSVSIVGPKDGTEEEKEEEGMFINGRNADTERQLTGYDVKKDDSRSRAVKTTMKPLGIRPLSKAQEKLFQKWSPNTVFWGKTSLKQCLAYLSRIERIRNEYLCYQCHAIGQQPMTSASKRTLIYNPPAVLVLHLKRFELTVSGFKKCNQRVTYDEYLDIGPYCSSSCLRLIEPDDANIWYSLYGVVVHMGSLTAGHYVSYIKVRDCDTHQAKKFLQQTFLNRDQVLSDDNIRKINASEGMQRSRKEWKPTEVDGRWFLVDDEDVKAVDKIEALSQEAYLLFYERVAKSYDTVV